MAIVYFGFGAFFNINMVVWLIIRRQMNPLKSVFALFFVYDSFTQVFVWNRYEWGKFWVIDGLITKCLRYSSTVIQDLIILKGLSLPIDLVESIWGHLSMVTF